MDHHKKYDNRTTGSTTGSTTEEQPAQQKLVEQFEHSAKRSEELAAHARQLGATLKALDNHVLSKQDLGDWRGHLSDFLPHG